jgi:hypothetical protein
MARWPVLVKCSYDDVAVVDLEHGLYAAALHGEGGPPGVHHLKFPVPSWPLENAFIEQVEEEVAQKGVQGHDAVRPAQRC